MFLLYLAVSQLVFFFPKYLFWEGIFYLSVLLLGFFILLAQKRWRILSVFGVESVVSFILIFFLVFLVKDWGAEVYILLTSYFLYWLEKWLKSENVESGIYAFVVILTVFGLYSLLYKFILAFDFLRFEYLLAIVLGVVTGVIFWALNCAFQTKISHTLGFAFIFALILFQIGWIVNFLPTSYYVNGGVLGILAGMLWEFFGYFSRPDLAMKRIWLMRSLIGVAGIISILVTAKWI